MRLRIGGEAIVATGIHRFWRAGKGWTVARDLKVGDHLRMVGGMVSVNSIEPGDTQPVKQPRRRRHPRFLCGKNGLLAHDFSLSSACWPHSTNCWKWGRAENFDGGD